MVNDRIEHSVTVNASLDRVWDLVTEPGWWIPTGTPASGDRTPGTRTVRDSAEYGRFEVEVVRMDPQTYAAFRWASQFPGEALAEGRTTLVEFFLTPHTDGVRVAVVESGFASLAAPESTREAGVHENTEGWHEMMAELTTRAEGSAAA